jgi:hypothetical protein
MKPVFNTGRLIEPAGRPDKTTPGLRGHSKPGVLVFFSVLRGRPFGGVLTGKGTLLAHRQPGDRRAVPAAVDQTVFDL